MVIQSQTFTFKDSQGNEIYVYKWMPNTAPRAIVQIAHGMVETAERYERLALALTKEGYGVYANDHLGHGRTAKTSDDVGHFEADAFNISVKVLQQLTGIIKQENPSLDVYLMGHSMGSFMVQKYI
ncbi:MAG: alpha/beta hydrolase, partial [Ignavibacteriales bacterium]